MKKTVKTTRGVLHYHRDWNESEGGVVMEDAQTIERYREIHNAQPDYDKYGVFFAFDKGQFQEGYKHLIELGHIKEGDKVFREPTLNAFGTEKGLDGFFQFYKDMDKKIAEECDPQEVYFYEYNNHECMYAWDGDKSAIDVIVKCWGIEVAEKIVRL